MEKTLKMLPLLSKDAKQVFGIPCSSAKSERVCVLVGLWFLRGWGRKWWRIKENGELVEEYKENCGRVFDLNDDAF